MLRKYTASFTISRMLHPCFIIVSSLLFNFGLATVENWTCSLCCCIQVLSPDGRMTAFSENCRLRAQCQTTCSVRIITIAATLFTAAPVVPSDWTWICTLKRRSYTATRIAKGRQENRMNERCYQTIKISRLSFVFACWCYCAYRVCSTAYKDEASR